MSAYYAQRTESHAYTLNASPQRVSAPRNVSGTSAIHSFMDAMRIACQLTGMNFESNTTMKTLRMLSMYDFNGEKRLRR